MRNYDYVPDQIHYDHPDVCGEDTDVSECSSAHTGANEREGQAEHDHQWITSCLVNDESSSDDEMRAQFETAGIRHEDAAFYILQRDDALKDPLHFKLRPAVNVGAALAVPADAEEGKRRVVFVTDECDPETAQAVWPDDGGEGLADWHRERDRIQNERDAEDRAWSEQAQLQEESDND